MALPTLSIADFTADLQISTQLEIELAEFVAIYLPDYLRQILGQSAIDKLETSATYPKSLDVLINGGQYVDRRGIKKYLKGALYGAKNFIWAQLHRSTLESTPIGLTKQDSETSTRDSSKIYMYLNQKLTVANVEVPKEFVYFFGETKTQNIELSSISNLGAEYSATADKPELLDVGNTMTIGGNTLTITVADNPIRFTATNIITQTTATAGYKPFTYLDYLYN